MGVVDRILGRNGNAVEATLREELRSVGWQSQLLEENLRALELQVSGDTEWRRMGAELDREFTRGGLDDLIKLARAMYMSHPLIQRAVNVKAYYTWAQGVEYAAVEPKIQDQIVDPMLANEGNRLELFSHQATILTDVDQQNDGNTFLALFTSDAGEINVRSIPTDEIIDIFSDPEDHVQIRYYHRRWSQREFNEETGTVEARAYQCYYPDILYFPDRRPDTIGGVDVRWDAPILHQRTGGLKQMRFGVPETYAALDWARAYRRFLEDWHTIVSSLARFAWRLTTKGSKVEQAKRKFGAATRGSELEEEPTGADAPPIPGSVFVGSASDDLTPVPKTGAHTSAEDAKPSRLMVAAASDLPDTILSGDPQQGNLATAKTLDRPTELAMRSRQSMWTDHRQRLFRYAIDANVRRGRLPGRIVRTQNGSVVEPSLDSLVKVTFPPILEHDTKETVDALVSAATLDGKTEAGTIPRDELSRQLMSAVGIEDIEGAMDNLDDETQAAVDQAVEQLREALKDLNAGDG